MVPTGAILPSGNVWHCLEMFLVVVPLGTGTTDIMGLEPRAAL